MPHAALAQVPDPVLDALIISGDDALCARLEALLESMGQGALSVGTLHQAREAMQAVFFPLMIVEHALADGDGLTFCREYRLRQLDRPVSVVLLSDGTEFEPIPAGVDLRVSRHSSDEQFRERLLQRPIPDALRTYGPGSAADGARLAALRSYAILDSQPEQEYDDITKLASHVAGTPMALVSLVDEHRQWFKSRVGVALRETPREYAFCAHAIDHPLEVFVVPDASVDLRFATNPLVTGKPHLRFYAGAPIVTNDGFALGTVCVLDTKPRDLDDTARRALVALARQTATLIEHRKRHMELEQALSARRSAEFELRRSETLFREAYEHSPIGIGLVSPGGDWLRVNQSLCDIVGYTEQEMLATSCQALTHPGDVAADLALIDNVLKGALKRYALEKRYVHRRGHIVWVSLSLSLVRDERGQPLYFVAQIQDISERKRESSAPRVSIVFGDPPASRS